jgi:GTP-binding protein Era
MTKKTSTHAGFVAILGAPNAGKSTLLNRLVGQKVSIVSPKPQTTRMRVLGVLTEGKTQIGFIDTPGIFVAKRKLDEAMVAAAWRSLEGADAIMLIVDAGARDVDEKIEPIVANLKEQKKRIILVLNKVDAMERQKLLPLTARLHAHGLFDEIFMISALTGDGVDDLKKHLVGKMPKSPWLYPEDQLSDLPTRLLAAEITREQLFRQLQQELPYAVAVIPESWQTRKDESIEIRQTIVVARENHKPIVLGKGGSRIKAIGEAARKEIAFLTGQRVHLFLEVKVDEKWAERPEFYQTFGLNT